MKQKVLSIYSYEDYREFLRKFLRDLNKTQRGSIGKLATSMGVNSAMVSQILHEKSHLSPEQALRLTKHFGFSNIETEYFMTMVSFNRAGDKETKKYFFDKLQSFAKLGKSLKVQLDYQEAKTPVNEGIYFSHWYYTAVWLLAAIKPQTKDSFSEALNLPVEILESVLSFLVETGMLQQELGQYTFNGVHLHAGKDSKHLRQHHTNWRFKGLQSIQQESLEKNFHFTGPIVISKDDAVKINSKILDFLKEFREISGPSACEELFCLNIDWFKVSK